MRRFKASRERKTEYIAQMEKRMRDNYRRRTGKEAESFVYCKNEKLDLVKINSYAPYAVI